MREKVILSLNDILSNDTSSRILETAIYNYAIEYCESNSIEPSWENMMFKHVYVLKCIHMQNIIKRNEDIRHKCADKSFCKIMPTLRFEEITMEDDATQHQEDDIENGMFKCRSCGSRKTTYYSLQTRSADEPMTNFITCTSCKKRWKN